MQGKRQDDGMLTLDVKFSEIHRKLMNGEFNFKGQVLLFFNAQNEKQVINQVYPELTTSTRKIINHNLDKWL